MEKRRGCIFDMDGTLCDVSGVRHFVVDTPKKDYHAFHTASEHCPPHEHVAQAARRAREEGLDVLIVTARRARYRDLTLRWLAKHRIPWSEFHIRADDDFRPDVEVKRDMLEVIRQTHEIVHAWDDNPNIIDLWEAHGIPCTIVPGWGTPAQRPAQEVQA